MGDPSAPTCRKWGKGQGGDYKGTISVTRNGATCEKWSKADLGNWAGGEMGKWRWSHNHCRNPNNQDRGPWCYVPGKKDSYYIGRQGWEYCSVPYCEGEDKGLENPDMYYCEFWPDHTMCKYKVRSFKTDLIIKNLSLMIVDAGANRGMLREGVADGG